MRLSDLQRHASEKPDFVAIVEDGREYSYREFYRWVSYLINLFGEYKLDNSRACAIFGNAFESWVISFALRFLGFDTICIKTIDVFRGLGVRMPCYVFSFEEYMENELREFCQTTENIRFSVPKLDGKSDIPGPVEIGEGYPMGGHICYTSGTTGNYKKVFYSQEVLESERYPVDRSDCPVYHSLGYMPWTAGGAKVPQRVWKKGGTVIYDRRSDWPAHFFDYPVAFGLLVSEYLKIICNSSVVQPAHFPRVEFLMGGGFIQEKYAFHFMKRFKCELYLAYGGTEFSTSLSRKIEKSEDLLWMDTVIENYLEIVDEYDNPVGANIEGKVRVKLYPWEPQGYYDDPVATASFYKDGYFYPGDMAMQREDGRIRILGRVNDVVVIDGLKVPVGPLEELAQAELGCTNVCLFTRQDDSGRESMIIVVEGHEFPDMQRIQFHSRHWKTKFDEIKYVKIEEFPRNDNGMQKLNRKKILDLALKQIEQG